MLHGSDSPPTSAMPRLSSLMAQTGPVLWQWQLETGEIFRSGPVRALLGIDPQLSADGYFDLVHPDDVGLIKSAVRLTRERQQPYRVQYRLLTPSGDLRWVEDEGELVVNRPGTSLTLHGVSRDITRMRALELRLQDAERRVAQDNQHLRRMHQLALLDPEVVEPVRLRRRLLELALAVLDGQSASLHLAGPPLRLAAHWAPALALDLQQSLMDAVQTTVQQVLESGERVVIEHPEGCAALNHRAVEQAGLGGVYGLPLRWPGRDPGAVLIVLWCGPRVISYEHALVLDVLGLRLGQLLHRSPLSAPSVRRPVPPVEPPRRVPSLHAVMDQLTPQQRRIAELMAEGQANREIAQTLGIAPNTVKAHVSSLLHRLGLHNRTQLAVMAQQGRLQDASRAAPAG